MNSVAIGNNLEVALVQQLLNNISNSSSVRPTLPTKLFFTFSIVKTVQLTTNGILTISSMMAFCWNDPRLSWNFTRDPVSTVTLPVSKIWTPSITLINSASSDYPVIPSTATSVMVFSNGTVILPFSTYLVATCTLDLTNFPFDSQNCTLRFTSLDSSDKTPMIMFLLNDTALSMELYSQTGEFYLKGMSHSLSTTTGQFCFFKLCYASLNITLQFTRKPAYYVTAMIIPAFTICILMAFAYLIPSENSVKITVSCTLMVSLYTLQQSVARVLPASADSSYLSNGLTCAVIFAGVTVLVVISQVSVKILGLGFFLNCFGLCQSSKTAKLDSNVFDQQQNATASKNVKTHKIKAANAVHPIELEQQSTMAADSSAVAHALQLSFNAFTSDNVDGIMDIVCGPSDKVLWQSQSQNNRLNMQVQLALLNLLQMQAQSVKDVQKKERKSAENLTKWRKIDIVVNVIMFTLCLSGSLFVLSASANVKLNF